MFMNRPLGKKKNSPGIIGNIYIILVAIILLYLFLFTGCTDEKNQFEMKLYIAITSNNLEAVREVLDEDVAIDYENLSFSEPTPFRNSDSRALALALSCADEVVVKELLNSGKVTTYTKDSYTYLDEALGNGSLELVELLLKHGSDVNAGEVPAIDRFMTFVNPKTKQSVEKVKRLLYHGAEINEQTIVASLQNEWRYLYSPKIVAYADDQAIDYDLAVGLKEAIRGNDEELQELIQKEKIKEKKEVLLFASATCDVATLCMMDRKGYSFDITDEYGLSPLHIAALCNGEEVVNYLLEKGLDYNQVTERILTPISYAAIGAKEENVKCFLKQGVSFQNGEDYSYTEEESFQTWTWGSACAFGNRESVSKLLSIGYEPTVFDYYHGYAQANEETFHNLLAMGIPFNDEWAGEYAIDYMPEEHVVELVSKGAFPTKFTYELAVEWRNHILLKDLLSDKIDNEVLSMALREAIVIGDLDSLKILLENDFEINQSIETEDTKTTLLHIASQNPSLRVVEYLLQQGADPQIEDEEGFLPYHYAIENDYLEIAELLKAVIVE